MSVVHQMIEGVLQSIVHLKFRQRKVRRSLLIEDGMDKRGRRDIVQRLKHEVQACGGKGVSSTHGSLPLRHGWRPGGKMLSMDSDSAGLYQLRGSS